LNFDTVAIEIREGGRIVITVPAGSRVVVLNGRNPTDGHVADVLWCGHVLRMFSIDIKNRAEFVKDMSRPRKARKLSVQTGRRWSGAGFIGSQRASS